MSACYGDEVTTLVPISTWRFGAGTGIRRAEGSSRKKAVAVQVGILGAKVKECRYFCHKNLNISVHATTSPRPCT